MLTANEIFGFMSPALAAEIIGYLHTSEKEVYRAILQGVAEAKKVRPIFLERKPLAARHQDMLVMLAKPRMDFLALNALQTWLLKKQSAMLADFLDALGIAHQNGAIDKLPEKMSEDKLIAAVEGLFAKYPREHVAVYLRAFNDLNEITWPELSAMLERDERLQLGA